MNTSHSVAVLIPCFNEGITIGKVISDFKKAVPNATIYIYDNNSSDETVSTASSAGAIISHEYRQGKGNVMRSMFAEIDADIYILVDGDDTYPADTAPEMIRLVAEGKADMVVGDRLSNGAYHQENTRPFHGLGNSLVRLLVNFLFKARLADIMSGYRVFNRMFVKNLPITSGGFEIETEMTIHALDKNYLVREVQVAYRDRPHGSVSKLNTYKDGIKVIRSIIYIFKDYRPFLFFGFLSLGFMLAGLACGAPVILEYVSSGVILHIPFAILSAALEILASLFMVCGMILDTVVRGEKTGYALRLIDYISMNGKFMGRDRHE